jgi:adenine-specific DNA-methyltransferase
MRHFHAIETEYSKQTPLEHRKKFAQFFTPLSIANIMVTWLLGNENLQRVLEPAFGLGIFSRTLLQQKNDVQIRGFEIDSRIYEYAQKEFSGTEKVDLVLKDYIFNDWQNRYDGILCNPPYFKFHDYDNKKAIQEIETKVRCKINGLTNLYALFLLKSIHQLEPGGRCAYIIPSEFLNADYGKWIKEHVLKTNALRHVIVFDFYENVFDDALTTASIILCANDDKTDKVHFSNIQTMNELDVIERLITACPQGFEIKTYSNSELDPEIKWKTYYQSQNRYKYKNLVPFSSYAKVMRGIATGANGYFTFNMSKAKTYSINDNYLLPCVCRASDVKGNVFTKSDFESLKRKDKNVFLLNAVQSDDEHVMRYVRKGEREEIDKKFLTANRTPWYALEKRPPAPIWVSVFNRVGLRFIRNEAHVLNLTTFHCAYPQSNLFQDISMDVLFAYLLTDTAKRIFEENSREYGNGLQKFEPNDLNTGKMLDLRRLTEGAQREIVVLYKKYVNSGDRRFVDAINDILVENFRTYTFQT